MGGTSTSSIPNDINSNGIDVFRIHIRIRIGSGFRGLLDPDSEFGHDTGTGPQLLINEPHVLDNGSHMFGNGPHVLDNGPHVLGNGPHWCTQFMNKVYIIMAR